MGKIVLYRGCGSVVIGLCLATVLCVPQCLAKRPLSPIEMQLYRGWSCSEYFPDVTAATYCGEITVLSATERIVFPYAFGLKDIEDVQNEVQYISPTYVCPAGTVHELFEGEWLDTEVDVDSDDDYTTREPEEE